MKKLYFLIVLQFLGIFNLFAQDYYISFNSTEVTDSIVVTNLTRGNSVTLDILDVLHLTRVSSVSELNNKNNKINIYPNPNNGEANITLTASKAGDYRIAISNLLGTYSFNKSFYLPVGKHSFKITNMASGMYLLNVSGNNMNISEKLLSKGQCTGTITINRKENNYSTKNVKDNTKSGIKSIKTYIDLDFAEGDNIEYKSYINNCYSRIIEIPSDSKTIEFTNYNNCIPIVETTAVSDITQTTASVGGVITDEGSNAISEKGICWSLTPFPTINNFKTEEGSGSDSFTSNLTGLTANTTYYVRAYATNSAGTSYGEQRNLVAGEIATLTTSAITAITHTTATSGGNITDNGGLNITARGVCWSTTQNPTTANSKTTDGTGAGSFTSNITELTLNTTYYVRAYAINFAGTSYGEQRSFTTNGPCLGVTPPTGYGVVESSGRCWLDRNLGASRVATSSTDEQAYGDLYQWGRLADGHQIRTSNTTATLSNSDTPGHGDFIINSEDPNDWRSPQNDNLWQGVNGINNPCPTGYRLPTYAEWQAEYQSWSSDNAAGAFASPLKLPMAGSRSRSNGSVGDVSSNGYYWSSTVDGIYTRSMSFSNSTSMYSSYRANGFSVRCLKD